MIHTEKELIAIQIEEMGDQHVMTTIETPMREDAFLLSDAEKIAQIEDKFRDIMNIMGMDLTDDSLQGTPHRVAKMYIKEIFSGLNPANKPAVKLFDNKYQYKEMLVERNITFYSNCEHHFVPIIGKAHVAYISGGKVIGLSKLKRVMETEDVAVLLDAVHLCVSSRGVQDFNSATVTSSYSGAFNNEATRNEFLKYVNLDK